MRRLRCETSPGPKQAEAHGLKKHEWEVTDEALHELIQSYTREAGVRNLERELANLARKSVKEIVTKKVDKMVIDMFQCRYLRGRQEVPLW